MNSLHKRMIALLALGSALTAAAEASAFCRATTCDPTEPGGCPANKQGCETSGSPLFWASNCVTVSVQADAAPKQHVDYDTAKASVERAFAAWMAVTCSDLPPSITVTVDGPVQCNQSEYNPDRGNANIVLFREDEWPYPGGQDALGVTFINFDPKSGEIWDVDIEVNAVAEPLSVEPAADDVDLDSLLTHEAGHLLGLAHTQDKAATMFPGYSPGSTSLRTLGYDDVSGLCEIYPGSRVTTSTSCVPRHGFSALCGADQPTPVSPPKTADDSKTSEGCNVSRRPQSSFGIWLAISTALAAFRRRRRGFY